LPLFTPKKNLAKSVGYCIEYQGLKKIWQSFIDIEQNFEKISTNKIKEKNPLSRVCL
jgi:hypothetical protein